MPLKPVDTAIVVSVGPLVDDTDFKTLETAIAYNAAGMSVDLFQETAAGVTKTDITPTTGGANDWTHEGNGVYELEITAAQNDAEGALWVVGVCDGVLPFESPRYTVVPAGVHNALVAGTDRLQVDAVEISGDSAAADNLEAYCDGTAPQPVDISKIGGSNVEHSAGYLKIKDASGGDVAPQSDTGPTLAKLEALMGVPVLTATTVAGGGQDITHYRGDTAPIGFDLSRDINGATLKFTVKRRHTDPQAAALVAKSSSESGEITITDAEAGQFAVKLAAGDTAALLPNGRPATFVYDVEMTLAGAVQTVAAGDFTLKPDVTTSS